MKPLKVAAVFSMLVLSSGQGVSDRALAEPAETGSPDTSSADAADVPYKEFGTDNIPIKLDVYRPGGTSLPAVILIHGGGWKSGDKAGRNQVIAASDLKTEGLAVFSINYRLTCNPNAVPTSVSDGRLCLREGHGTPGGPNEAFNDVKDALMWVRDNASTYNVDSTRVGVLGASAGGNLAGLLGVQGIDGYSRADAVVSLSGPMHLEIFPLDDGGAARERYIGCPWSGTGSCPQAWDDASPLHNCCNTGNIAAGTPFLMFNSVSELIEEEEMDDMYNRLNNDTIPATKVLRSGGGHAFGYWAQTISTADGDQITSNEGENPNGKSVMQATADYFLSHL